MQKMYSEHLYQDIKKSQIVETRSNKEYVLKFLKWLSLFERNMWFLDRLEII